MPIHSRLNFLLPWLPKVLIPVAGRISNFLLIAALLIMAAAAVSWQKRDTAIEGLLESVLNLSMKESFEGPVVLTGLHLGPDGGLAIEKAEASLKTLNGPFPFETENIKLKWGRPTVITFQHLRPSRSQDEGAEGRVVITSFFKQHFEADVDVKALDLREFEGLDPQNLSGSSGKMSGHVRLRQGPGENQEFLAELLVPEPGGEIQAKFFDLLIPYLPGANQKAIRAQLPAKGIVAYHHANFRVERAGPGKIKLLLNILVPNYNLNLNLNAEVRVEEDSMFSQIAQIMGYAKVSV